MRLEEFRAHHRAQCKGHDSGYDDRYGDSYGELTEQLTGDAGKEAHRHEHGTEHKGHRHERSPDFAHRLLGRLIRGQVLSRHDTVHILHHDDGVIDHDSDGKNKSEKRHHIQREAEDEHDSEGSYQ